MSNSYILDKFVSVKAGDPYRLFAFGEITRGGVTRTITPEYAAQFKLPPFKPPVKLGSHEDTTPAGGHITRLEVREDGLYAYPEFTDKGNKAVSEGDYRYHSPEVIWDDGALETSDGVIAGPLILGDALLHSPYLGEATAFYSTNTIKENDMQENISVPKSFLETLLGYLQPKKQEAPEQPESPEPVKVEETEQFKAAIKEREDYKAQLDAIKAESEAKELKSAIVSQLQKREDFGAVYESLDAATDAAAHFAALPADEREYFMRQIKALTAQIDESKLTGEQGKENAPAIGGDPKAEFGAQVEAIMKEKKVNYVDAFNVAKTVHADLFTAAYGKS
jgi:hypothetical protein